MMRDKDARGVIAELAPIAARVFTVTVGNARSFTGPDLAKLVRETAPNIPVRDFASLPVALKAAELEQQPILITGSLFLVGEALVELGIVDAAGEESDQ
jgi:dihydrofolate synthase/folylpolyglutamate synthase